MSRAQARTMFDHVVGAIPMRKAALRKLCSQNGYDNTPSGWTRLIADNVEQEASEIDGLPELTPFWRTVVFDVSLAISDLLIERGDGQLEWKLYAGSKNSPDYHHPVIVGFSSVAKSYQAELYRPITNMAIKAACGRPMRGLDEYLEHMAAKI